MIGYACINTELQKQKITSNRGMRLATFNQKGISYALELAYKNLQDVYSIIQWNEANNIKFYRLSSDIFPWMSEYDLDYIPKSHIDLLSQIGKFAIGHNHRITFHPGPYNVLCSPNILVVDKTIKEINAHAKIMDFMGLEMSPYYKINIHVGGVYGDKSIAMNRFCQKFKLLSYSARKRLTIENDDKINGYTVEDLMYIHENTGIPIVFDLLHHQCNSGGLESTKAYRISKMSWGDTKPVIHISESRDLLNKKAHSDFVKGLYHEYLDSDIMIEAKQKEQATILFIENNINKGEGNAN